ncbi:acyltransferase [Marinomonas sp.]|uniref:acyltransferase n=1 Tax=Marinomonas sp. TaxID=1904862 RepID=UPI003F980B81
MFDFFKKRILGNKFGVLPTVKRLWQKGGMSLIRGTIFKVLFLRKSSFPFFLGKGCRVFNTSFLRTGRNVYIGDYSYFDCLSKQGVRLGNNVTIREFAWCQLTSSLSRPGEAIIIGDGSYIGPRCILGAAAPLKIGKNCQIGANVSFVAENHRFEGHDDIINQGVIRKGITLGDDCWLGNNVIVLDGVIIGNGVVIGAGSIVTKSIPDGSIAYGSPCRVIRSRYG